MSTPVSAVSQGVVEEVGRQDGADLGADEDRGAAPGARELDEHADRHIMATGVA